MFRFLGTVFLAMMFGISATLAITTGDGGFTLFAILFAVLTTLSAVVFISEEKLTS